MIFHTPPPPKKIIKKSTIDRVYEFNFLGLTINENLNWNSHIDKIADKIWKKE